MDLITGPLLVKSATPGPEFGTARIPWLLASHPGLSEKTRASQATTDIGVSTPWDDDSVSVKQTSPVVALVSSAGGREAMTSVLAELPKDLPAAVVALQHVSPERDSELSRLLARRSALPVSWARDGQSLVVGSVLVAPSGCHTLIAPDRCVVLIASGAFPPSRPSADLLLSTLALAVGPQAIAVILTGAGHDGATGATTVHHQGGVVLATDEESSHNFSMPASALGRDCVVDATVPLSDLAQRVTDLVQARRCPSNPATPPTRADTRPGRSHT
jgi:two-component system, chemotaxis family, protein-glutamate methylesterase/glutaminase